jgi:hypothetical protein
LSDDLLVQLARFSELPGLEQLIGGLDFRSRRLS